MLYPARIRAITSKYMGDRSTHEILRLVVAPTDDEAYALIEQALDRPDPYGDSIRVEVLELSETIGDLSGIQT